MPMKLRFILRYTSYLACSILVAIGYVLLLLNLHFSDIYIPDDNFNTSVRGQNIVYLYYIVYSSPLVGLLLATRKKWLRLVAVVIVLGVWIWPYLHWLLIGSPK
ncbi:MAG: hypothetical protein ACXVP5_10090 [Tumebacillaceae bacterium]